jgi:hypothetical protein
MGYGMSYTTFRFSDLQEPDTIDDKKLTVNVIVTKTGFRDGWHVEQVYGKPYSANKNFPFASAPWLRPVKFAAGKSKTGNYGIDTAAAEVGEWCVHIRSKSAMIEVAGFVGSHHRSLT